MAQDYRSVCALLPRDSDGKLSAYAWPGGYQIHYLFADGDACCAKCANGENGSDASPAAEDRQWRIIGAQIHWEGDPLTCAHCGADIAAEYGADGRA